MPRPCAVEAHARNYKKPFITVADATALCRGGSRSQLERTFITVADATALCRGGSRSQLERTFITVEDATALCRGGSRSQLQKDFHKACGCHGLVPWRLTLVVTK